MIALVLGVALAVWFANDREYATLYSDLDEQQAGKVTEELKTRKRTVSAERRWHDGHGAIRPSL